MALPALVRINDIVNELLFLTGRDDSYYPRYLQLCINGYRDLAKHHIQDSVKTRKLLPNEQFVVFYPEDALRVLNVYVNIGGMKESLTQRKDMVDTDTMVGGVPYRLYDGEGAPLGVYGNSMPGGIHNTVGYYVDDVDNRRILLLMDAVTPVFIEYTSIGIDDMDDAVPVVVKEALEAYVLWKLSLYDRNAAINERMLRKTIYDEEVMKLRSMYTFNLNELKDALNS